MKLTIFNGSPRAKKGNTGLIIDLIMENFSGQDSKVHELRKLTDHGKYIKNDNSDLLFVFPLYCDAMPGIVMEFIEEMERKKQFYRGRSCWFFIHSGFAETKQSRFAERAMDALCVSLEMKNRGVCILGNSSLLSINGGNSLAVKKLRRKIRQLSRFIQRGEDFDDGLKRKFSMFEDLPAFSKWLFSKTNISEASMNSYFKTLKGFDEVLPKMFDQPYAKQRRY